MIPKGKLWWHGILFLNQLFVGLAWKPSLSSSLRSETRSRGQSFVNWITRRQASQRTRIKERGRRERLNLRSLAQIFVGWSWSHEREWDEDRTNRAERGGEEKAKSSKSRALFLYPWTWAGFNFSFQVFVAAVEIYLPWVNRKWIQLLTDLHTCVLLACLECHRLMLRRGFSAFLSEYLPMGPKWNILRIPRRYWFLEWPMCFCQ